MFIGTQGKIEEQWVPQAGYPLSTIQIGSLNRVSRKRQLKTLCQLPLRILSLMFFLFKHRPSWVIGVGGYSSGPVLVAAWCVRFLKQFPMRLAILEQNLISGLTNRWLSRLVDCVFTAFPLSVPLCKGTPQYVVGNPVRSELSRLPTSFFSVKNSEEHPFTILVMGGSQGSRGLNQLVLQSLEELSDLKRGILWIHQTGTKDYPWVQSVYVQCQSRAQVYPFIHEMKKTYAQCHLLICRAGASTLAEIAAIGRTALLVPLPTAADDHQAHNARLFVNQQAALSLDEKKTSGKELADLIRGFYQYPERLHDFEKRVHALSFPQAAETLWDTWEKKGRVL